MGKSSKLIDRSKSLSAPINEQAWNLPSAQLGEHPGHNGENDSKDRVFSQCPGVYHYPAVPVSSGPGAAPHRV